MEETIFDYLRKERIEAKNDFKERTEYQEKIIKRHSELSGEIAKAGTKDELYKIIEIVDSWISNFNDLERNNLFYLGDVPEAYLAYTWKDFVKKWKPNFEQLRDRAKFKAENIKQQSPEPQQINTNLEIEMLEKIADEIIGLKYINPESKNHFIWALGGKTEIEKFLPIIWNPAKGGFKRIVNTCFGQDHK